jgi:dienelactone hydrolase
VISCPGYLGWVQDVARQWTDSLLRIATEADRAGRARRATLTTPEAVAAYQRWLRERFATVMPELPQGGDVRRIGDLRHGRYTLSRLLIETFPGRRTPAVVWRHDELQAPAAGVLFCSGHFTRAWRPAEYQAVCMDLARHGFVVLAYGPIGQGERRYFWDPSKGVTLNVNEHSAPGQRLLLLGGSFAQYRIWDGMRAIDYLLSRPEVDGSRIGCTGHSGGGWATLFITLLDDRIKCAACNEPGPQHWWPLETQPDVPFRVIDSEQYLFPAAARGIDRCDMYQAIAPRPMQLANEYFIAAPGRRDRFTRNRLSPLARAHIEA